MFSYTIKQGAAPLVLHTLNVRVHSFQWAEDPSLFKTFHRVHPFFATQLLRKKNLYFFKPMYCKFSCRLSSQLTEKQIKPFPLLRTQILSVRV